jgi:hypothetical protein
MQQDTSAKDAAARQERAEGLVNTMIDAKAENDLRRRDALLVELCELHKAWPQDAALREWLAKGLLNTLNDAKEENDLRRRDELLVELVKFQQRYQNSHRAVISGIVGCPLDTDSLDTGCLLIRLFDHVQ